MTDETRARLSDEQIAQFDVALSKSWLAQSLTHWVKEDIRTALRELQQRREAERQTKRPGSEAPASAPKETP